jgi:alpha-glucosidase
MKRIGLVVLAFLFTTMNVVGQKKYTVKSPDKKLVIKAVVGKDIQLSIQKNGKTILSPSPISMTLENQVFGINPKVIKKSTNSVNRDLKPEINIKESSVKENYNGLKLDFKGNYSLSVRAYNDGVAYRFESTIADSIYVKSEKAEFNFPQNNTCWWGGQKSFYSHYQVYYNYESLDELNDGDLGVMPLVIKTGKGPKIVITETDLRDYPGMWLKGADGTTLTAAHPKYPKTTYMTNDRLEFVKTTEDYIAKTTGTRTFPWRIFAVADNDADLISNQLTYLLASENTLGDDLSWIKPGKIAWDWWNANNIEGVDFEAGVNTETYKYYIDFAAKYGIEYIVIDEGWYELGDLTKETPDMNMDEITSYAKEKGVDVILWVVWKTLDNQLDEGMALFDKWGIKGIKVDFMNRDDQWMVNYYERIAKKSAEHKLVVDFHGSFKPSGLRRMYPNVLTSEGVNGGEQYKWSTHQTPEHNLITPFGRGLAGPMDYQPGAMNNAQEENFEPIFNRPMSMGTRTHQLAMYVCYESPLQMLCDTPTKYYKEPEAMEFISAVPVVWNETIALDAKVSDYLVVARRNGDKWFVGAMTDWSERELEIDFSFLDKNKKYKMIIIQDGVNANRIATDFKRVEKEITSADKMKIKMAKGGGWVAQILPVE